jgi:serine/threonine protein kinase
MQQVKICDLGFAKVKTEMERDLSSHSTKGHGGSLLWRAPELFGRKPAHRSVATDVYAYGR